MMRVTQSNMSRTLADDLGRSLREAYAAQQQVSTGRRFQRPSEDPLAALTVLRSQRDLRAVAQYQRGIQTANARLATEEGVINQLQNVLDAARDIALSQGTVTATTNTRRLAAAELQGLIDQVVTLGNTRSGNEYVFGGSRTDAPPFTADPVPDAVDPAAHRNYVYAGNAGAAAERRIEIGDGNVLAVNTDGDRLLVSSGVLSSLVSLRNALATDDVAAVGAAIQPVQDAFDEVAVVLADVAGRSRVAEAAGLYATTVQADTETREGEAWNVEFEQATVRLAQIQTSMQAALLAGSRVLNLNLSDYLR